MLPGKKKEKERQNIYVDIDLDPRRGKKYPEFNLQDVIDEQKRKMVNYNSDEEDRRFVDPDALELVRKIEERYARKGKKLKKGKLVVDDFVDKSRGYDLTDPFVDDSEVHEEYIPSTTHTTKGGFFINKGKLNFEDVAHNDDDDSLYDEDEEQRKRPVTAMRPWESVRREERAPAIPGLSQRSSAIPNLTNRARS